MILGSHVRMSAPEFLLGSVKEALSYDADALMVYTGAPQNTVRKAVDALLVDDALALMEQHHIPQDRLIVHAPYLINPANSVKPEVKELAFSFLKSELKRTAAFHARYMVLHPGSYTTTDPETGIKSAATLLNALGDYLEDVVICLETMAGKGSEIGRSFDELASLLEKLEHPHKFGICLDTCHIHDAGYDVADFDEVLDQLEHSIGLNRLHVIHLNDSKNERGSRKDRHANIGDGKIGFDALLRVACNPRTAEIPKILETPYIDKIPPYKEEIQRLRDAEASLVL